MMIVYTTERTILSRCRGVPLSCCDTGRCRMWAQRAPVPARIDSQGRRVRRTLGLLNIRWHIQIVMIKWR